MAKIINKCSNTIKSLDFVLKDLLEQIKIIAQDQKDISYMKLIELFFKGIDLKEKIGASSRDEVESPQINFLESLNKDKIV